MMIEFKRKPYYIKITFRCYFKYEQIAKRPFDINDYDKHIWMYSILKASNKDFEFNFDDFAEIISKNEDKLNEFIVLFYKEIERVKKENNSVFLLNKREYTNELISTEDIYVILVHDYKFSPIYLFDEASIDEINLLIKDYYKRKTEK